MPRYRIYYTTQIVCREEVIAENLQAALDREFSPMDVVDAVHAGNWDTDGAPEKPGCWDVLHYCRICGKEEETDHETDEYWPRIDLCAECALGAQETRDKRADAIRPGEE